MEKQTPLLPYNAEAYANGNYTLVYRDGSPIREFITFSPLADGSYPTHPVCTVTEYGASYLHYPDGRCYSTLTHSKDVFMRRDIEKHWLVLSLGDTVSATTFRERDHAVTYADADPSRVVIDAKQIYLDHYHKQLTDDKA